MLNLKKEIYKKFFFTLVGVFVVLFSLAYFLLKDLLLSQLNPQHDNIILIMDSYNTIWAEILIAFVMLGTVAFLYIKRLSDTLLEDVQHLSEYMQAINNKNYEAIIQIQHYTEFLKIALIFKNLVKRLKKKEKK
ncbi:hypothetical protein [Sulfurimonas sp.]|uniref:hypothetical protein n=1 Tax=Sulfurimonas sp. TaxID=2022749 RepID=UPI002620C041|nr:hypothetical protein [Sulfurimonas sp.]